MVYPPVNYQASVGSKRLSTVAALVKRAFAMLLSQMAASGIKALELLAAFVAAEELLGLSFLLTFFTGCCVWRPVSSRFA